MTRIHDLAYIHARREQSRLYGKEFTNLDNAVAGAVLRAARLAMQDVEQGRKDVSFRVVNAPTGTGKTTGSVAVAKAGIIDPTFSAAFVVETIRQVDELGMQLIRLIGHEHVRVWSSGHDLTNSDEQQREIEQDNGKLLAPRSLKSELRDARIVVVTHKLWKGAIDRKQELGVRFYRGVRRSVVFVDEHPDLVQPIGMMPGAILALRDLVIKHSPQHPAAGALKKLSDQAEAAIRGEGANYKPAPLFAPELLLPHNPVPVEAWCAALGINPDKLLSHELGEVERTCRFLQASFKGCCFRSRDGFTLVSYEADFDPGPGHVLLDATADVTGMVSLRDDTKVINVDGVDFSPLTVVHVQQPKTFANVNKIVDRARTAKPYAEWIMSTVLAHTEPGDDVLVVTHKAMIDRGYLPGSEDPDNPLDWKGRRVNTIHWGIGIGSNKYRHKTVVFTFSEHHRPRRAAIADTYGWTGKPLNTKTLAGANTRQPQGDFLIARDGHLLRWTKQLACRGAVRNIDADGKCGRMKWVTTMEPARLIENLPRMFPGAALPAIGPGDDGQALSKPDRLIHLLTTTDKNTLWANEIEELSGIKSTELSTVIDRTKRLQTVMKAGGWRLVPAKALGASGRMKALHRRETTTDNDYHSHPPAVAVPIDEFSADRLHGPEIRCQLDGVRT